MEGGREARGLVDEIWDPWLFRRRVKRREWIGLGISNPSNNANFNLSQYRGMRGRNPYQNK